MADLVAHIAAGGGICGTCAEPATATAENEGYSSCCNDRIEYGSEASETVARAARDAAGLSCPHEHLREETERAWNKTDGWFPVVNTVCADCGCTTADGSL